MDPLDFQYGKEKGLALPIFSIIKKTAFSPPIFSSENKRKAFSQELKKASRNTLLWQIYNGWEQITKNPMYGRECFNLEPIQDHSPKMGPMIG